MSKVILVDKNDTEIGYEDKLVAHKKGMLHRAFSIFVFNSQDEVMLQQRAKHKYHSGGLWSNTTCSHPIPKEDLNKTVHRRLKEEMGFDCQLKELFTFTYRAELDNGIIENEIDHVLVGRYDEKPVINPEEVLDWKWMSIKDLQRDMAENPKDYTVWFKISINEVVRKYINGQEYIVGSNL